MLSDIVSKNGNLLLNVPVRGDGSIDEKEEKVLEGIAAWMDVNQEAIFNTRPWKTFGEGPASAGTELKEQGSSSAAVGAPFSALQSKGGFVVWPGAGTSHGRKKQINFSKRLMPQPVNSLGGVTIGRPFEEEGESGIRDRAILHACRRTDFGKAQRRMAGDLEMTS